MLTKIILLRKNLWNDIVICIPKTNALSVYLLLDKNPM